MSEKVELGLEALDYEDWGFEDREFGFMIVRVLGMSDLG